MARARNIKPGFFKNELLVEMCAFDRLLFIGLWLLADREGRIEDRPKRIKMELFPCDTYDVDAGLTILVESGFVKRYEINVKSVIVIVNFHKHQTPHGSEKDSELPDTDGNLTIHDRDSRGYVTGKKRENKVKPQNNVKYENSNGALQDELRHFPVSNALNPESCILNPDSLNPDSKDNGCSAVAEPTAKTVSVKNLVSEGVDKQKAADWLVLRKAKRLPLTQSAWIDTKLEGEKVGLTPAMTVAHAVGCNWAGFKSSWYLKDNSCEPVKKSFRQQDEDAARDLYLRATGQKYQKTTIDAETGFLEIGS
jgi:hypothetical protein